jgi:primosomal protein N' (replication factor Y)
MLYKKETEFGAKVVIDGLPMPLYYRIPLAEAQVDIGSQVIVEVGNRKAKGHVIEKSPLKQILENLNEEQQQKQKKVTQTPQLLLLPEADLLSKKKSKLTANELKAVLSSDFAFDPKQLELFEWMTEYYGSTLSEVIENAIPKKSNGRLVSWATLNDDQYQKLLADPEALEKLNKKAPKQIQILELIAKSAGKLEVSALLSQIKSAGSVIASLRKKQLVKIEQATFLETLTLNQEKLSAVNLSYEKPAQLNESQTFAVSKISESVTKNEYQGFLLFGVTGSGKTEVYLRAIEEALAKGGSALILVPEISLTPQLLDLFQSRLSVPLGILHSQVGDSERWQTWQSILSGDLRVVIGARSAIFAPLKNLSLIILDEEHDSSYKQSDSLRYHGREVAIKRAKMCNCPFVLGSATPSFESLLAVQKKELTLIEMPNRATSNPLPEIEIVDLNKIRRKEFPSENISPQLHVAISNTLEKKGQVIILFNRRGFSAYLQCDTCGEVVLCPNCSVSLTHHQHKGRLVCHYCNLSMMPPKFCKHCRDPKLSRIETDKTPTPKTEAELEKIGLLSKRGSGTERVVEELAELFPLAKIIRMDRDAVTKKGAHRDILSQMKSGEADILVGTQMIAKGHDLPGVTLVGIIDADLGLHLPDFRSSERVFQLLTQASGRAGRGEEKGLVIIQTREPNHPTIVATATSRFKAFARYELEHRKVLNYPPYGKMLRLVISSPDRQSAHFYAELVDQKLQTKIKDLIAEFKEENKETDKANQEPLKLSTLGPAPAPLEKIKTRYRWQIIVKSNSIETLSKLAGYFCAEKNKIKEQYRKTQADFRLAIDVDPIDML